MWNVTLSRGAAAVATREVYARTPARRVQLCVPSPGGLVHLVSAIILTRVAIESHLTKSAIDAVMTRLTRERGFMATDGHEIKSKAGRAPAVVFTSRFAVRVVRPCLIAAATFAAIGLIALPSSLGPSSTPQGGAIKRFGSKLKQELKRDAKVVESVAARYARYVRNAAKMRTFHESVPLESGPLLDVLRRHGVGRGGQQRGGAPAGAAPGRATRFPVATYAGGFNWPVEAGIVSSEFGPRWGKMHSGIDIAADAGEPVYATAPGVVIYADDGMTGYGNLVIVRHDTNVTTLYAHNIRLEAREGTSVKAGALIAKVGSTGHSTGPHLHFEMRDGDRAVNPRERLPANRYIGK